MGTLKESTIQIELRKFKVTLHQLFGMFEWFSFLRMCLLCGLYEPPVDILCKKCWVRYKALSKGQLTANSLLYDFPVKRIWIWSEENNFYIKKIIYNLKGGHSPRVYEKLSLMLLQKITFEYYQGREIIFVPAPSIRPQKNHALFLARALSEITGCRYKDLLKINGKNKKQKRLNKKQRAEKFFDINREIKEKNSKQYIFVDDVITTGSTARAAFEAMGRPRNFEVWALAEKLNFNQPKLGRIERLLA